MNNKQNFINLMQEVISTNSPATRLNSLYEFFRLEPNFLTLEEQTELLAKFKDARDKKSNAGKNDIAKRWDKIKETNKQKSTGWACMKSSYGKVCSGCSSRYEIDDIIFLKNKKAYHPGCAPPEAHQDEVAQSHYQRFLKSEGDEQI